MNIKNRKLEIEDSFKLKYISKTIFKNSTEIFFEEKRIDKEVNDYKDIVYSYSLNTKEVKQFTCGITKDTNVSLSKNKEYLSFISSRAEKQKPQLWIMPVDGGEAIFELPRPKGSGFLVHRQSHGGP